MPHSRCPAADAEGHNMLNVFLVRDSVFSKALDHLHFLHLVSVLHKRGAEVQKEETCEIDEYLMFILT